MIAVITLTSILVGGEFLVDKMFDSIETKKRLEVTVENSQLKRNLTRDEKRMLKSLKPFAPNTEALALAISMYGAMTYSEKIWKIIQAFEMSSAISSSDRYDEVNKVTESLVHEMITSNDTEIKEQVKEYLESI